MEVAVKTALLRLRAATVDKCDRCFGHGYLFSPGGEETACTCMQLFRYLKGLYIAGIPEAYWGWTIEETPIDPEAVAIVRSYLEHLDTAIERGIGVLFSGPNGTGKTTLMCEIGKAAVAAGYPVRYLTVEGYVVSHAALYAHPGRERPSLDEKVLLLDELDKPYMKEGSSYVAKLVEELVREAIVKSQALIMATNETATGLSGLYGASFLSALQRTVEMVPVMGEDLSPRLQHSWGKRLRLAPDYSGKALAAFASAYHQKNFVESY